MDDPSATKTARPSPGQGAIATATISAGARVAVAGVAFAEVSEGRGAAEPIGIPPSLYARFEGFQLLGRGGMGVVYRARDLRLGRDVAIKLLLDTGSASGTVLREARSQARLRHEHACEVYEAGVADNVPFVAMQLIEGEPFSKAKEGMTLEEKVLVVRGVASALHEAHRLGMVHRDVKPGNVLVERGEDGACRPFIVDFGLARDVSADGPTLTAGVQGTPAFMAPEQAAGKVQLIDRRTDVYGLGATLYDALAGRPPFAGDSVLDVMRRVTDDEPPPLRVHHPGIAKDLEAIVMKCLEKDQGARYASAKALGEDLQRFLDGDAVLARRSSWAAVLWKRARKHKVKVGLALALVVAALTVAGLWIRSWREGVRRAELARELGERVVEMELFLRIAQGMPLHDLERERDVVRGRLREIEARMAEAGEIGLGPGHDALGRGLLALGDPAGAVAHFREAERSGYRSSGLDYATGVALSALYKQALDGTKRIQNEAQRKARVAEIEAEYKAPAVVRLRAALGHPVAPAAYVEGLIALHEGREEDAVERAKAAYEDAPWMHEAKKLEGDALFAQGSRYGADKAFDYDKAMAAFERAAGAYAEAGRLGRSDPAVYTAECELWTQRMNAESEHGAPVRPAFEQARAACERAIQASPRTAAGYVALAGVHNGFAYWVAAGREKGEDPEPAWREAEVRTREAASRSPNDPMAHYMVGAVGRTRALDAMMQGRSALAALATAIGGYEAALRLDPDFLWALSELCSSLAMRGKAESLHGEDPRASFAAAAERCEQARALDASFMYSTSARVLVSLREAEHLLRAGSSPEPALTAALAVLAAVEKQSPTWPQLPYWRARLATVNAAYLIAAGGEAEEALSQAQAAVSRLDPGSAGKDETQGLVLLAKARAALARNQDAEAAIRDARAALGRAVAASPLDVDDRIWLAEAHLLAFRQAASQGRADAAPLDAALAALSPLGGGAAPVVDPRVYTTLAEIRAARAGLSIRDRRALEREAEEGIARANDALAQHPRFGAALSVLGRLWLLRARAADSLSSRKEAASRAAAALGKAFEANPLLAREEQPLLDEARRFERGEGPPH